MDLALNTTTWDLDFPNGDLHMVTDQDCVVQFLRQKLKLFQGEWFMDESTGVPYFDYVFVKNPSMNVVDSIFKLQILNTPGIAEILSFSMNLDTQLRSLNLSFTARSQTGIIDFSETVRAF